MLKHCTVQVGPNLTSAYSCLDRRRQTEAKGGATTTRKFGIPLVLFLEPNRLGSLKLKRTTHEYIPQDGAEQEHMCKLVELSVRYGAQNVIHVKI